MNINDVQLNLMCKASQFIVAGGATVDNDFYTCNRHLIYAGSLSVEDLAKREKLEKSEKNNRR